MLVNICVCMCSRVEVQRPSQGEHDGAESGDNLLESARSFCSVGPGDQFRSSDSLIGAVILHTISPAFSLAFETGSLSKPEVH